MTDCSFICLNNFSNKMIIRHQFNFYLIVRNHQNLLEQTLQYLDYIYVVGVALEKVVFEKELYSMISFWI